LNLTVTGRHFDVTEALKNYVEEKLSRLQRYADDIISVHVILEMEKRDAIVEVNLVMKRCHINVKERNKDMYAAVDKAFDVVKKQVIRHEEKLKSHRVKKEGEIGG
jgi:putative sigma-54 modulation protein